MDKLTCPPFMMHGKWHGIFMWHDCYAVIAVPGPSGAQESAQVKKAFCTRKAISRHATFARKAAFHASHLLLAMPMDERWPFTVPAPFFAVNKFYHVCSKCVF
jgi:hypothetical protein